jgi:hypothetical protein
MYSTVHPFLLHTSKLSFQWQCCFFVFVYVVYICCTQLFCESSISAFQNFVSYIYIYIYIYIYTYIHIYAYMYVCTSSGGLDSRYPAVPTVIQISFKLLPISRYCWILMPDPRYSIVNCLCCFYESSLSDISFLLLKFIFRYFTCSSSSSSCCCCCWIKTFFSRSL